MERGKGQSSLEFPTVDDWWVLSRAYPEFRKASQTPLKDYGYLRTLHFMAAHQPRRVLEFGHGLGHSGEDTLYAFAENIEMWGIDDWMDLPYYPSKEAWEKAYSQYINRFAKMKFVRGLLGNQERTRGKIPEKYFDLIYSVSVLEEVNRKVFQQILEHCYALLVPGGHLLFSHDVRTNDAKRVRRVIRLVKAAGFTLNAHWWDGWKIKQKNVLLENQIIAMLFYQAGSSKGENRTYKGNWMTVVVDAIKP
jgi:SAM-dependent methyltransferase